jgi:signal transduction histidine kinase
VSLTLSGTPDAAQITVHNEGDPIPRTHLESIFESFTRAPGRTDATTGQAQNLGLGLFISREVVTAHGGKISATSTLAEGTTFSIRLPRTET